MTFQIKIPYKCSWRHYSYETTLSFRINGINTIRGNSVILNCGFCCDITDSLATHVILSECGRIFYSCNHHYNKFDNIRLDVQKTMIHLYCALSMLLIEDLSKKIMLTLMDFPYWIHKA